MFYVQEQVWVEDAKQTVPQKFPQQFATRDEAMAFITSRRKLSAFKDAKFEIVEELNAGEGN